LSIASGSSAGDRPRVAGSPRPSLLSSGGGAAPERDEGPLSILEAIDGRPKRREPAASSQPRRRAAWVGGGLLALLLGGWGVSQWSAPDTAELAPPMVARNASAVAPAGTASAVLALAPVAPTPAVVEGLPQEAASAVRVVQQAAPALAAASAAAADALPPVAALAAAAAATSLVAPAASAPAAKAHRKHKDKDKAADAVAVRAAAAGSKADKTASVVASKGKPAAPAHRDADVDLIAAVMRHADPVAPAAGVAAAPSVRASESSIAGLVARCKTLAGAEAKACRRRICDGYWGKADACPAKLAPQHSKTAP